MTGVSVVITAHREGVLAGPSLASAFEAADALVRGGGRAEVVAVLDRPDAMTRAVFEGVSRDLKIYEADFGEPGLARNLGVARSRHDFIAFLDADDLWSSNWLTAAAAFHSREDRPNLVLHSEANLVFGARQELWWHADSQAPGFDPGYMRVGNYWDALTFAPRALHLRRPFERNALAEGYGHEDWLWNCVTLAEGVAHRPVPGTVHFKRRRSGSQMSRCDENDVVVRPNPLTPFAATSERPVVHAGDLVHTSAERPKGGGG